MKVKQKKIQIFLVLIGLILILGTYIYYPYMKKVRLEENQKNEKKSLTKIEDAKDSSFTNVQYQGVYDLNKSFTVESEQAHILNEEPDLVYMTKMHVILYLNDGRIVNITSDKGRYNKATYDCFFEKNVKATDGDTNILAENLDLLGTENLVKIYNNVYIDYPTGSLVADKIDYDFETKHFKVSMFDEKAIKMKLIQ